MNEIQKHPGQLFSPFFSVAPPLKLQKMTHNSKRIISYIIMLMIASLRGE